jgi:hypothetical protein
MCNRGTADRPRALHRRTTAGSADTAAETLPRISVPAPPRHFSRSAARTCTANQGSLSSSTRSPFCITPDPGRPGPRSPSSAETQSERYRLHGLLPSSNLKARYRPNIHSCRSLSVTLRPDVIGRRQKKNCLKDILGTVIRSTKNQQNSVGLDTVLPSVFSGVYSFVLQSPRP